MNKTLRTMATRFACMSGMLSGMFYSSHDSVLLGVAVLLALLTIGCYIDAAATGNLRTKE